MIINDFDNRKTIDTTTGIFLTKVAQRPNEHLEVFEIHDGNQIIDLAVTYDFISGENGKFTIKRHRAASQYIKNNPDAYAKYSVLIQDLIASYGYSYGRRSGEFTESILDLADLNRDS
jgi:hypothetical protein